MSPTDQKLYEEWLHELDMEARTESLIDRADRELSEDAEQ